MMTENTGTLELAIHQQHQQQIIKSNSRENNHNNSLQQQQIPGTITIKSEPDYEYSDDSGNSIAHNYTRNHIKNEDQQQQQQQQQQQSDMLSTTAANIIEQDGNLVGGGGGGGGGGTTTGNLYHINNSGGSNGGGGGGGGGNNINDTGSSRRSVLNNTTMQQQQYPRQHTSLSPPPPQQISHIRNQQQTVVRSSSPASTSPTTTWQQQSQHNQQQSITTNNDQNSGQHQQQQQISPPPNAFGILRHEQDILYITETCIEIGRNSSTSSVHFHVAKNSFVSRKHFQIVYDPQTGDFYLICLSKNGIFVDDVFQRRSTEAVKLPKSCTFRFPSTEIRIAFESFSDKVQNNIKTVENSNVIYSPLKISIPKQEQKSPYPSPTGTISAANSCPTSPRQGFQEYHQYNYNNNNNFQNNQEMFQPPSTSTYNEHEKPPYSYAQLIVQSISASPDKQLTLSGIYSFISKHYPYYRKEANKGWQNSIRHNLSLNRYFIKVARSQDEPGKGSFWRIDPNSEAKLIDQSYKKRRQRGSQCFRPPYGMPRSAPVSPSHIDNSRENSPLHDIVLQSAPGSPGVSYQNNNHGGENNHASASNEETNNYGNQNAVQQQSYNSHNQYNNSSNYYTPSSSTSTLTSTSSSGGGGGGGGGGGVSGCVTIGSLKRHQPSSTPTGNSGPGGGAIIHSGGGGRNNMYDDMSDYGQGADSDDCETIKRQKYTNEVN